MSIAVALVCAELAVTGTFSEGLLQESTGVHRGTVGAVYPMGKLSLDAQVHAEGWIGWKEDVGIHATGFGGAVGVRWAFSDERIVGPFVNAGFIALGLVGGEKTVDMTPTGNGDVGPGAFAPRVGVGYGFRAAQNTTVAFKLEVSKWILTGQDFPADSPDPFPNPWSIHLGLEFMRWL